MKFFLAFAILMLCGCAASTDLRLDSSPLPAGSDASSHYVGTATLDGSYQMLEGGDICFIPDMKVTSAIPQGATLCFSNEQRAIELLGVSAAVDAIDTKEICGLEGRAQVVVSGVWSGHGPASDWYTTELTSVISKEPASAIDCGG